MKVMLLNFPLSDIGGITTWANQIVKGYAKIGIQADHYYCNRTGRFKCSRDEFTFIGGKFRRGEKVPSESLGFNYKSIGYYINLLNDYDYVLFVHPSPHPTKANRNIPDMIDWLELYKIAKEKGKKVVVIFHDKNWHKTNKWFIDASPYIDLILAAQHNFIDSVNHYVKESGNEKIKTDWLYFPLEIPDRAVLGNLRNHKFCMMPQWIKWKNHHLLFQDIENLKYPIHFYNAGMQYHYLCKKKVWEDNILKDHVEDEELDGKLHEFHGFVTYDKVKEVYASTLASIDLTTRTYQNYTHHEGMLHGCVLCCTEECREGLYNHIPDGHFWPVDMDDISGSLNNFIETDESIKNEIREKAYDHVAENFACDKIASKITKLISEMSV